jgi:hypothetical protein
VQEHITKHLQTGVYSASGINRISEDTVLLMANELGSPLHHPHALDPQLTQNRSADISGSPESQPTEGLAPGEFGRHTRLIASHSVFQTVIQHERLGSADQTYDKTTSLYLHEFRQRCIAVQASLILRRIQWSVPNVQRIVALGHSAGAAQIIDIIRSIHEQDLLPKVGLGHVAITNMVVHDPPFQYNPFPMGQIRYGLYQPYERLCLTSLPKTAGEQISTPGGRARAVVDARYNMQSWTDGVGRNLNWIAENAPDTAVFVAAPTHSPNNMLHRPGQARRTVEELNRLRGDSHATQPFQAEVLPGTHANGSRYEFMTYLLQDVAGVRR